MSEQAGEAAAKVSGEDNESGSVATVAGTVLSAFFDELEKADALGEKATKLRKLVLEEGVMAEPAIRAILFPEVQ
jgi:hypothetical protein